MLFLWKLFNARAKHEQICAYNWSPKWGELFCEIRIRDMDLDLAKGVCACVCVRVRVRD